MHPTLSLHRTAVLAGALVALGVPLLSSCGFDAATDRPNVIAAAVNDQQGKIEILGAVIVGSGPGTGVFEATLSNSTSLASAAASPSTGAGQPSASSTAATGDPGTTPTADGTAAPETLPAGADQLLSIKGGSAGGLQATAPIDQFVIQPAAAVNLVTDDRGIPVKGTWTNPGPFVTVVLTFASGQVSTIQVPVVKPCFTYAGIIDTPTPSAGSTDAVGGGNADTDPFSCDAETQPSASSSAPSDQGTP